MQPSVLYCTARHLTGQQSDDIQKEVEAYCPGYSCVIHSSGQKLRPYNPSPALVIVESGSQSSTASEQLLECCYQWNWPVIIPPKGGLARVPWKLVLRPVGLPSIYKLTDRQREILWALVHFDSNSRIARELHISEDTVNDHLSKIRNALGLSGSRVTLAVFAMRHGLDK